MENNFNIDDPLEQFLQDNVKDQKMYPSEYVWENIRTSIHGDRSWPALTFIALFIITALTIATIFNYPPKTIITRTSSISDKTADHSNQLLPKESLQEQINPGNYTSKTLAYIKKNSEDLTISKPSITPNAIVIPITTNDANKLIVNSKIVLKPASVNKIAQLQPNLAMLQNIVSNSADTSVQSANSLMSDSKSLPNRKRRPAKNDFYTGVTNNEEDPNVDNYLNDFGYQPRQKKRIKSKFELQFYVTPSISYRKLEDDEIRLLYSTTPSATTSTSNSVPLAQNLTNVNNIVRHTPALGMELGAGLLYSLSPNIKLTTGIQFNERQYYIDASQSSNIATIAIVQNNRLDSVQFLSSFSNSRGFNNIKIDNKLYQLSIPIGLQWDFIHANRLGISFGASIEPTITLNKNVYMISTDYKYYANGASFFRKLNFNTSVDLNITYQIGDLKWYLAPQIRYQHLPTYTDLYPIKEYRWDYGLKIGVLLPLYK
jgi:hypothetical protein